MKTKLVLAGTNGQDEKILLAIELKAADNKVDIYSFADSVATEEFSQKLMSDWRDGKEVEFPEHTLIERELSVSESLLPEDIKVDRGDLIQRAQTEWHFVVLSNKLHAAYETELAELKATVDGLESYSKDAWNSLKEFWGKLQEQTREKNLFRGHADSLRDGTNALFTQMKEMRSKADAEMKEKSKGVYDSFMTTLGEIETKIENDARFQSIFNDLKNLQRKFKDTNMARDHRNKVYDRIDKAFKTAKAKRFGDDGGSRNADNSAMGRLQNRYSGLLAAIDRMSRTIKRDRDDLEFQAHRIATSDGQLEAQIRQAKIKMIEERVVSKEVKLEDMMKTKLELEEKMEKQKERDARNAEKAERDKAKAVAAEAAKAKIAAEMAAAAAAQAGNTEKLTAAAEKIAAEKKPKTPVTPEPVAAEDTPKGAVEEASETLELKAVTAEDAPKGKVETPKAEPVKKEESMMAAVSTIVGESLEDVVDTVKAVASVMGDKIEDAVEELKEKVMNDDEEE
jgi:hypothetical protein